MLRYLIKHPAFWFGAFFLVAGLGVVFFFLSDVANEEKLKEDGKIITGTVQEKEYLSGSKNNPEEYLITYRFTPPNGTAQTSVNGVLQEDYEALDVGDSVRVLYSASNPTNHRLEISPPLPTSGFGFSIFLAIPALFSLIGLAMLGAAIRRALRQSQIWNNGIAAKGRVTQFKCDNPDDNEDKTYHIVYEYEGPNGETYSGRSQSHSRGWFMRIDEGDEIDIAYDPQNPGVSEWRKEME